MKPRRFYHSLPGFLWAYIKWTQVRVVLQWLGGELVGEDMTPPTPERRMRLHRVPRPSPHVAGRTHAEIADRLLAQTQGRTTHALIVEESTR